MGRATSGVLGMRFNDGDELLTLGVVHPDTYLLVATNGGYAKRTPIDDYPVQGRGGKGVLTVQYDSRRGRLVGAVIVDEDDELYAITSAGGVIRTSAREVRKAGRQTKGVRLMNLGEGTTLVAIARSAEVENGNGAESGADGESVPTDTVELPAEGNAVDEQGVITEDGDTPAESQE
jgi:DNA gyrase subunit A